jgi:hypothetical protein
MINQLLDVCCLDISVDPPQPHAIRSSLALAQACSHRFREKCPAVNAVTASMGNADYSLG